MVKVLYNLLYHQVILQVSCNFSRAERNTILKRRHNRATTHSETILAEIIEYFSESGLYGTDDDKPSTSASPTYARVKLHCVEQQVHSINIIQLLPKYVFLKLTLLNKLSRFICFIPYNSIFKRNNISWKEM